MFLVNFTLMFHHKYSLAEIEGMIPWERDIYMRFINAYLEEENARLQQEAKQKAR